MSGQAGGTRSTWSGSARWTPARVQRPADAGEVAAVVQEAARRGQTVRAIGAGHSFSPLAVTSGVQLELGRLSGVVAVDEETGRARVRGGTALHRLGPELAAHGRALANMGDIDRQSLAGAISTGTHGTGLAFTGYPGMVTGLELVTSDGAVRRLSVGAEDPEEAALFEAARVGLGALGVVTEVELETAPAFLLHAVERAEPLEQVVEEFVARSRAADHVEFFWFPGSTRALTKTNTRLPLGSLRSPVPAWRERLADGLLGNGAFELLCRAGAAVPRAVGPLGRLATWGAGERECTDLAHRVFVTRRDVRFREMEYALPLERFAEAFAGVRRINEALLRAGRGVSFPVEVRTAAADEVWLSPGYGRQSVYIAVHMYHRQDPAEYFAAVEELFVGLGGRPHWGKMHTRDAAWTAGAYPRFAEWAAVRDRVDPGRVFTNAHVDAVVGA